MEANLLLGVDGVAKALSVSPRSVWRFRDGGVMPAPVCLGRSVRWRKSDIEAWIAASCPDCRKTGWTPSAAQIGGAK